MLAFFYSLYLALIRGYWEEVSYTSATAKIGDLVNKTATLIVNALGGNFETLQTFTIVDSTLNIAYIIAGVLSIITMCIVCALVFKLTKMIFSIFFGGR